MAADPGAPDEVLVELARRGDPAAFEQLVRRHYRAAYAVALAGTGRVQDAEDVCQESFVRALAKLDTCRDPARFAGWLLAIVRNRAHNVRESEALRAGVPLDEIDAARPASQDRQAALRELRHRLVGVLAQLSPRQREIVLLHDLEHWTHGRIAEALEISEVASRQHLFTARRTLRVLLGGDAMKDHGDA